MANISKVELNGTTYNIKTSGSIPTSEKGAANGVASLDSTGKVPSSQLPSYVDDVLEYSAKSSFPTTGETGKIYVDTSTNKTYRWSGSAYVEISESLALGETSSTAYRGDRGKAAYDHSQTTSGNPHNVTKSDVGLGNVGNFKAVSTVASQGLSNTEKSNARANIGAGTGNGTYSKPSGGIPKSDLATAVQTSLNQVATNQTNILYALRKVGTNMFNFEAWANNATVTKYGTKSVSENTITISATNNSDTYTEYSENRYPVDARIPVNAGDKLYMSWDYSSADNVTGNVYIFGNAGTSSMANANATDGHLEYTVPASGISYITMRVGLGSNQSGKSGTWSNIQIIMKSAYDSGLTNFTPYALPNYDLTRLQSEDRAGLVECVDGGAKNLLSIEGATREVNQVTATYNSDGSITTSGTASGGNANFTIRTYTPAEAAKLSGLVLSGCPSGGSTGTWRLILQKNSANYDVYAEDTGNGAVVGTVPSAACVLILQIKSGYSKNATWYPMLCTKAAFGVSQKFVPFGTDPFYQVPINHNMIYRGRNLGATLTDAQHTALSSGNFTDLYLGDYWTKTVTIPAGTYTGGDGEEVTVPAQTNITLKAVIADFDTFYAGYASTYAGINTHHAAVIVTGFSNVVWNKTNSTAGGYVASLIHKWLVGSVLPQIETWFGSAKVLSHQKLLTNAITGDAASGWAWSSQKISLLSENQMYGSKVWGNSKATNGGYEPGEAFKHLNVFNHIDANLLFGNKNIWLRDIASAGWAAFLRYIGIAYRDVASATWVAPAALILLS